MNGEKLWRPLDSQVLDEVRLLKNMKKWPQLRVCKLRWWDVSPYKCLLTLKAGWNLVCFPMCEHLCMNHGHVPGRPECVSTMPTNAVFLYFLLCFLSLCPSWIFCVGENADKVGIVQKENPLLCLFAIKSFVICYYIMESRNNCTLAFGVILEDVSWCAAGDIPSLFCWRIIK